MNTLEHRARAEELSNLATSSEEDRAAAGFAYWARSDLATLGQLHATLAGPNPPPTITTTDLDELAVLHEVTAPSAEALAGFAAALGVEVTTPPPQEV